MPSFRSSVRRRIVGSYAVLVRAAEKYHAAARNTLKVIRISHRCFADDHQRDDRKHDDRDKKPQKAPFAAALFLFRLLFRLLQRFGAVLRGIGNVVLFLLRLVRVVGIVFAVLLFVFFTFLVRGALLALALGVSRHRAAHSRRPGGRSRRRARHSILPALPARDAVPRRDHPPAEYSSRRNSPPAVCRPNWQAFGLYVALFLGVSFLSIYDIR